MEGIFKFAVFMLVVLGMPLGIMYVVAPIARAVGRRIEGGVGADDEELDAMRAELDQLRELPARVAELEDRVDFAERALQRAREESVPGLRGGDDAAR